MYYISKKAIFFVEIVVIGRHPFHALNLCYQMTIQSKLSEGVTQRTKKNSLLKTWDPLILYLSSGGPKGVWLMQVTPEWDQSSR